MKLYYITFNTNYGTGSAIIEAESEEKCKELCNNNTEIWDDFSINEIIKTNTNSIIYIHS